MTEETKRLFEERLARHQAAIALEPLDRLPLIFQTDYALAYAGYTRQETVYDFRKRTESLAKFVHDFPELDSFDAITGLGDPWGALYDTVGWKQYKLPGRDLPPNDPFQYVEQEWMMADEYDLLIKDPVEFLMNCYLPRVFSEFQERGSTRSYMAFLKSGMAFMILGGQMGQMAKRLEKDYGMPLVVRGVFVAPFDKLADRLRGLQGIMMDLYRQPQKVLEACEAMIPAVVTCALATADRKRRYPIWVPLDRGGLPFLSPKQFDTFYWPSLKKCLLMLIDAGYTVRIAMGGDWTHNWHHVRELPRGKVICQLDQSDIFRAKEEIGDWVCLAGNIPSSLFILGTPDQIRATVKELCERVGRDGGYLIDCDSPVPASSKPENFRAFVDAVMEYGKLNDTVKPKLKVAVPPVGSPERPASELPDIMPTPWGVKLKELGGVTGDESLIQKQWEMLERIAYTWLWFWS